MKRILYSTLISLASLIFLLGVAPSGFAQSNTESNFRKPVIEKPATLGKPKCRTITTRTGNVMRYCSKAEPGDLISYDFDFANKTYYAENLTNNDGRIYSGKFDRYFDDGTQTDLLAFEQRGKTYYAISSENRFLATNFPAGTEKTSISSGINTKINNRNNFNAFDGYYLYFILNLDGNPNMDWGVAEFRADEETPGEGYFLLAQYNTEDILPDELTWDQIYEDLYSDNAREGFYAIDRAEPSAFDIYFDDAYGDEYLPATGYATSSEGVIIADLGYGNGYFQAVKISDVIGLQREYGYIQSDVDFGSGAGLFQVSEDETEIAMQHYDDEGNEDISETLNLEEGGIENMYFTDLFDYGNTGESTERLYLFVSGHFIMHFTIEVDAEGYGGKLLNYGVGAEMTD